MNKILSQDDIASLMNDLEEKPVDLFTFDIPESENVDFRYYNKLTYEQELKAIGKIKDNVSHFTRSLFKTIEKKEVELKDVSVSTNCFSNIKEGFYLPSFTKRYKIEGEDLFINIPQSSVNFILNKKENTPLDKTSFFTINKDFFSLFENHLSYDFTGVIESDENKEVLSSKLGEEDIENDTKDINPLIKCKGGDSNIFTSLTFSYEYKKETFSFTLSFSYQALLTFINEEKFVGKLHSPSFYQKKGFYAVLCAGKLKEEQINDIKEGSVLKFKTSIDDTIKLYFNEKFIGEGYCEKPISDFYSVYKYMMEGAKGFSNTNTYLALGILPQDKFTEDENRVIKLDTRVSSALPLIYDEKIIALAFPFSIADKYACKIVKKLDPPIAIK